MPVYIILCIIYNTVRRTALLFVDMSVTLIRVGPPGVFYTYFYNHVHRLRLEKRLCIEHSRSSNGYFKPLLDPGGGFRIETAVA